jgi:uncharacterized membrane protein SpoIIM required for sporulation
VSLNAKKQLIVDILKGSTLVGLFILPAGTIIVPAVVIMANKFGLNLLPSAFINKKEEKKKSEELNITSTS